MDYTQDKHGNPVTVEHFPEENLYAALYRGSASHDYASAVHYKDHDGERIFYSVQTPDEFAGRGLAGIATEFALRDTAEAGLRVVPLCPYVVNYVAKHEFAGELREADEHDREWVSLN
ncbi:predicted acetyltransferase [Corynebacterium renale]|uniref:GNAT family N-acetyltransferase n=1 Tax=Corynebacterium renale TaxID=1724 RepID=UPI000DA26B54|nr:GNAT family N-acetyltransferase [Corynebacterium renale]SQG65200.1 predicted acetyltransferase [Corynebacterium renale]STC98300.1 predicted acetyltransferase [Corynebacterium renale]